MLLRVGKTPPQNKTKQKRRKKKKKEGFGVKKETPLALPGVH